MSNFTPVEPDQIKKDITFIHQLLDSDLTTIPGNLSESLTSGKGLLRAILGGELHVCFDAPGKEASEAPKE